MEFVAVARRAIPVACAMGTTAVWIATAHPLVLPPTMNVAPAPAQVFQAAFVIVRGIPPMNVGYVADPDSPLESVVDKR
jgi:hypothetical protein